MWRLMKAFFFIAFLSGVTSLIFLVFYSVRHKSYKIVNSEEQLRRLGLVKSPTLQGTNAELGTNIKTKTTLSSLDTSPTTFSRRSVITERKLTQPPVIVQQPTSKTTETGDSVDKLIEETLEKSKKQSHAEGDESDPTESHENNAESEPPPTPANEQGEKVNPSSSAGDVDEDLESCPVKPPSLTGPLYVNQNIPKMEQLEKHLSEEYGGWVQKGGAWRPTHCKARVKMALIIPFRKRYEQLAIFVRHMHPMLKRQELDYRIIIVEQSGDTPFNRAILFNIGYKEALKFQDFNCFIFHDVDLIPEDDRNMYSCPSSPRHMSVAVDKFNYRLPYASIFGGAGSFLKQHFEEINGFSNKFWGWGGEDDDLYQRVVAKGHHLTRPSLQIGRYKMIRIHHHQSSKADPNRFDLLKNSNVRMATDGLNSLKYKVLKVKEELLYTLVSIHVEPSMIS